MKLHQPAIEPCPKCESDLNIRPKLLLLAKDSPVEVLTLEEKCGRRRRYKLAIHECDPDVLEAPPLEQFVAGLYCDRCGIGYVPDSYIRSDLSVDLLKKWEPMNAMRIF